MIREHAWSKGKISEERHNIRGLLRYLKADVPFILIICHQIKSFLLRFLNSRKVRSVIHLKRKRLKNIKQLVLLSAPTERVKILYVGSP